MIIRRFGLALAALALLAGRAMASAPTEITIPGDHVFPESITSSHDGTLYGSSIGEGRIWRVKPGSDTAESFVPPGKDLMSTMGVLADDTAGVLYACSNDWTKLGVTTPGGSGPPALKKFALKTGKLLGSYNFPGGIGACNDIAVGKDGAAYVTDSTNPRVLRLPKGGKALEIWVENPIFGTQGVNLDGIAFGADGNLYVTGFTEGKLFRVTVEPGMKAGAVSELTTSQPIAHPDGMRPLGSGHGTQFLLIEGGHLDTVAIDGDKAAISVLKPDLPGGVAVTRVGNVAWALDGQLRYVFDKTAQGKAPAPFHAYAVPLPAN
jgi:sugar lactone lactonase YvrE